MKLKYCGLFKKLVFCLFLVLMSTAEARDVLDVVNSSVQKHLNVKETLTLQDILSIEKIPDVGSERGAPLLGSAGNLTVTGAGNVRFLQAFFYSDTGCTTLLGVASVIDNGADGLSFTTGQTISVNSDSAYKLANNKGITTGNIQCMKLYVTGGNESPKGIPCQSFTNISCSGTSCTSTQTKTVTWGASPTVCATQYAYISNAGEQDLTKCTVDGSDGTLSNCIGVGGGFDLPRGVGINNGYLTVVNDDADNFTRCVVSVVDGTLSGCAISESGDLNDSFASVYNNQFWYSSNQQDNNAVVCTVSPSDGSFSGCTLAATAQFSSPLGLRINNGYVYVLNQTTANVRKCTVDASDGTFSSCSNTAGFTQGRGVAINNNYIYVPLFDADDVKKCKISTSDGTLSECGSTGGGALFKGPVGIIFNHAYAYVVNQSDNTVLICDVHAVTGALSGCAVTGVEVPVAYNAPRDIYIY